MQQFQVPQFIDIEDRIIGPLTLKQFFYLLAAAGVGLMGWFFLHLVLFVLIALPLAGLFAAMAFVKISGRPFPVIFMSAVNYYLKPRLYLWRSRPAPKPSQLSQLIRGGEPPPAPASLLGAAPKLSERKLGELAWSLDITERIGDRG